MTEQICTNQPPDFTKAVALAKKMLIEKLTSKLTVEETKIYGQAISACRSFVGISLDDTKSTKEQSATKKNAEEKFYAVFPREVSQRIIYSLINYLRKLARRYTHRLGSSMDATDLISAGQQAVLEGLWRWDYTVGANLLTYVFSRLSLGMARTANNDGFQAYGRIPEYRQILKRKIFFFAVSFVSKNSREPTTEEIIDELKDDEEKAIVNGVKISVDVVKDAIAGMISDTVLSVEDIYETLGGRGDKGQKGGVWDNYALRDRTESPETIVALNQEFQRLLNLQRKIQKVARSLERPNKGPRFQRIANERLLQETHERTTYSALGTALGVTRERVSQLEDELVERVIPFVLTNYYDYMQRYREENGGSRKLTGQKNDKSLAIRFIRDLANIIGRMRQEVSYEESQSN